MYTKAKQIKNGTLYSLDNYIEGYDVYNSLLLEKLQHTEYTKDIIYTITRYEGRPDLIASDIYGSSDYMDLLMLQCGMLCTDFTIGTTIQVFSRDILESILTEVCQK